MRIGINGFGRIGRLVFRALWGRPGLEVVHVNDCAGDAATAAHLLQFDSVHGRWQHEVRPHSTGFHVEDKLVRYASESDPTKVRWSDSGVEMLLECSGIFNTSKSIQLCLNKLSMENLDVTCRCWINCPLSEKSFSLGKRELDGAHKENEKVLNVLPLQALL